MNNGYTCAVRKSANTLMVQLFIKPSSGPTFVENLNEEDIVGFLREKWISENIISLDTLITYAGKVLYDDVTLEDAGLVDDSTVYLVETLDGGKKRKRKTYTTPKRIKHKRKKIKMKSLKFYSVEKDGVKRLLASCAKCGPGVFMAKHFDRSYCGKCCESIRKVGKSA